MDLMPIIWITPVWFVLGRYQREFESTLYGGKLDVYVFGFSTYAVVYGYLFAALFGIAFLLNRLEQPGIMLAIQVLAAVPGTLAVRAVLAWRLRVERKRDRDMLEE
jgi:hypothetical protein